MQGIVQELLLYNEKQERDNYFMVGKNQVGD